MYNLYTIHYCYRLMQRNHITYNITTSFFAGYSFCYFDYNIVYIYIKCNYRQNILSVYNYFWLFGRNILSYFYLKQNKSPNSEHMLFQCEWKIEKLAKPTFDYVIFKLSAYRDIHLRQYSVFWITKSMFINFLYESYM